MKLNNFANFKEVCLNNKNFIITEYLNADLDTPISLSLKLKKLCKYSFLFESAEKDKHKGRFSAIGLLPDLIWSCNNQQITIEHQSKITIHKKQSNKQIKDSLEHLISSSKLSNNDKLPPIASGIFGYMSYDMVKYFENIPAHKKDDINIPEAEFLRPTTLIIFDNLTNELIICIPIWQDDSSNIKKLYKEKNLY